MKNTEILCVGVTSYDLYYQIDHHPDQDEKMNAVNFAECGGGPAANAAYTAARLGRKVSFAGYIGKDYYGRKHLAELQATGVDTSMVYQDDIITPVSVVLVKQGGHRALINYRNKAGIIPLDFINPTQINTKILLMDGHEPQISMQFLDSFKNRKVISILDAGSVHSGTELLAGKVDYLIGSEIFALDYTGKSDSDEALTALSATAPNIIITLGAKGLIWKNRLTSGKMSAFDIKALDTTGAGDVFHGAFAVSLLENESFEQALKFAGAAAALSCTKLGGRTGAPYRAEIIQLLEQQNPKIQYYQK
ncbi:MAG: hypothetical protein JXR46_13400 [Calditrichaceae bacterium]|nr:hypothetical protein [Calditrichaceae bacterium]MBN2710032.1 hypothetical protein [Calditrichaceae bacterium]RQV92132.1 MAG: carbohydrate kinase [Calditrichota bacterium]